MFQEFKSEVVGAIFLELPISVLDVSPSFASVALRINGLNRYDDGVEVISVAKEVFDSRSGGAVRTCVVFLGVYDAKLSGELPLQSSAKLECLRWWHIFASEEI